MQLNADLVVLGACETGLGTQTRSEGLMGMTWAFQAAGAKSVLMSLWSVEAAATVSLLRDFYHQLKWGQSKADALRAAQMHAIASSERNSPYQWAAFMLDGAAQ